MTLRLILIRHAKSDWSSPEQADHDRPLNPRGRASAPLVGEWLAGRGYLPGLVLCSDAVRTVQTLELILPHLGPAELRHLPQLYHASPDRILAQVAPGMPRTLMVVGHNPGIGELAGLLLHRPATHPRYADFPTAATAVIEFTAEGWSEVGFGRGSLRDFIVPADLVEG